LRSCFVGIQSRYDRVLCLLEVCERLGIGVRAHPSQETIEVRPLRACDEHPELLCEMVRRKADLLMALRYMERVREEVAEACD